MVSEVNAFKAQFDDAALVGERAFVSELAHQEHAPSIGLLEVFRSRWVGYVFKVEAGALVRDAEEQIVALQLVLDGKVKIAGFDIDSSPRTPAIFKIMSVPTLMFFKGGEPVDTVIGLQPKQALKARIEKLLS